MGKLRHIALSVDDVEEARKFFEEAFDMESVGESGTGTAYLTDAGMTGPHDSVIGVRQDIAIERFLTQVPIRFKPAEENVKFCGVLIDVDPASGRSLAIERLQIDLQFSGGGSNDSDD